VIIGIAGVLVALLILGIDIALAAFGGLLFAVLLRALTDFLKRHTPLPDVAALSIVVLAIVAIMAVGAWVAAPRIAEHIDQLGNQLPVLVADVEQYLEQYDWGQWILQRFREAELADGAPGIVGGFLSAFSRWLTYLLVVVFVGLFLAANPGLYVDGVVHLTPLPHRDRMRQLLYALGHTLRWFLIGQGMAMILIGTSTALVLWLLNIPLAGVLGTIVGLLGFIPYLGPIIGLIPVALVASTEGAWRLLFVLIAYTTVQILEGYVATPLIQHRTVYLPPAFTIVTQILLGTVLGVLGFVLATPLAAVMLVLARFYRTDILGDKDAEEHG
jgi:predicted PurR-regulated permease PerM